MHSNTLKVWFIDDEGHLRETIKKCFKLTSEAGTFNDNIYIRVINGSEKGKYALNDIKRNKTQTENIPDIIFCDLRLSKTDESDITSPSELSGVKLLEEIASLKEYDKTLLFVFSQIDLSDADKSVILKKLSFSNRKALFLEKTNLYLDEVSLDKIEDVRIEKNCEALHSYMTYFSEKLKN